MRTPALWDSESTATNSSTRALLPSPPTSLVSITPDPGQRTTDYHSSMLLPGSPAPEFILPDHNAAEVRLSDFRGRWVVIWWYAKAATEG